MLVTANTRVRASACGGGEEIQREGHILLFYKLVEACDDVTSAHASGIVRAMLSFCIEVVDIASSSVLLQQLSEFAIVSLLLAF